MAIDDTKTNFKTGRMINIPTELLRTLVAVVDLQIFTKAAQSLGVTQPAVSAQIKRLQMLLDCELFDKSAPGVSLTPSPAISSINYARRMLCINDQIVDLAAPRLGSQCVAYRRAGRFPHAGLLPRLLTRNSEPAIPIFGFVAQPNISTRCRAICGRANST